MWFEYHVRTYQKDLFIEILNVRQLFKHREGNLLSIETRHLLVRKYTCVLADS